MDILRVTSIGSVDDGKSTLIGQILFSTKNLKNDQLEKLQSLTRELGDKDLALAYLLDGLKSEKASGITVDVAYRYFESKNRRFILADCPGHIEFLRNMATGCSQSDACLLMIDATRGIRPQTLRHLSIAALFEVSQVLVCINKMDAVSDQQNVFERLQKEIVIEAQRLGVINITCIPVSALKGQNVCTSQAKFPWFEGPSVLDFLHHAPVTPASDQDLLFQTQLVSPTSGDVLGKLISGQLAVGDTVWLDGVQQVIEKISHGKNTVSRVQAPLSIAIGISKKTSQSSAPLVRRGDWIVSRPDLAQAINRLSLEVVWLSNEDVQTGTFLRLKYLGQESRACVLEVEPSGRSDKIFYLKLSLSHPIYLWSGAPFKSCRGMILQDFEKNWTVAAGLWLPVSAH